VAIFSEPTQNRQLMPAGQHFFSAFEAPAAEPVEYQTHAGRTQPA
jgi:hypothetical protein